MNCYEFKGGNGTSSRLVRYGSHTFTVAAFVQANFGARAELTVAGHRVGARIPVDNPLADNWLADDLGVPPPGAGSVIAIIATDAPLLPGQCKALARRVPLGLARTGTSGSHFSGDIFLAFSTAPAPGLVNTGRPLPLALHQCDPRLQQRLQSRIAVGMGAHVRLGTESLLQRLPKELLERIVKHLEYGLPFHEFIYEDLHAKCPGLTPAFSLLQRLAFQDCTEIVARIFSFIRFLHEAAERQKKAQWPWRCRPSHELGSITSQNADPLMNWDQLQSTVPGGQEITEEVADILLKRVAGLLGVDILLWGVKTSGGARWTELAVPRQCLVLDTSAVNALVNAHNGPAWPVAGQFPSDEHVQAVNLCERSICVLRT
jgi:hypothetical protein